MTIPDHGGWVLGVAFSPDGKLLATASADRTLRFWETGTWKAVASQKQSEAVQAAAFSPDGTLVAAAVGGPSERSVRIGRKDDTKPARAAPMGLASPLGLAWAKKGERIYVATSDATVKALRAADNRIEATLRGHGDWVRALAVSPDGTRIATGSGDGTVKLWNAADGALLATLVHLAPRADEWLVATGPGYFATATANAVAWRAKSQPIPPASLTAAFGSPETVRRILSGKRVAPPVYR